MRRARPFRPAISRRAILAAAGLVALLATPAAEAAPPVEQNLPPAPISHNRTPAPPNVTINDNSTPIDGRLTAVVFLGPLDSIRLPGSVPAGIDAAAVPPLESAAFEARVKPLLGRPISLKLIGELEAAAANWFRDEGQPFVSISTPPQEITGGVLQFRVIPFHVGKVAPEATGRMTQDQLMTEVRAPLGQPVDATALAQDLDWLNRSPFRQVTAQFSPGTALGETDLDLKVTESKPWQVFAGYANSGSAATDFNRYFVGATIGDVPTINSVLSYQLTASPDFWAAHGEPFGDTGDARYISNAGRFVIPVAPRQDVEGTISFVETNETAVPFAVHNDTFEAAFGYRTALPATPMLAGDATGGFEVRRERQTESFAGIPISDDTADIFQLYLGWNGKSSDALGKTEADATLHVSPGGLDSLNTASAFSAYSSGRVASPQYAYADFDLTRSLNLPQGVVLSTAISGQLAGQALPDTEQITLGGENAVRGYTADDGAFDVGIVARNEVRTPVVQLGKAVTLSPFGLLDVGYGHNFAGAPDLLAAAAGVGVDLWVGSSFTANLSLADALRDGPTTKAGDWRLDAHLTAQY